MTDSSYGDLNELTIDERQGVRVAQARTAIDRPPQVLTDEVGTAPGGDGEGPGSLSRRFLRPETLISFLIGIAILAFFVRRLDIHPYQVWHNVRQTNLALYGLAFVAFYSGFFLRARRWRQMLARVGVDKAHGCDVPSTGGIVEIFLLSWFANCIVPAKLGDAYRSYLMKKESGSSFSSGLGTIVSERLMDLFVLFVAMSVVGVIEFRHHMPGEAQQAFLLGLALLAFAAIVLTVVWFSRHTLERRLPERVREQYTRLHGAVFACLRRPWAFLATSVGIWVLEGVRVFLVARALGADVSFETATFVALMSALLTTLPITPAGIGVVETFMITVLYWTGINHSMGTSIALLDRVIGYWSIVLVGLILYIRRFRKEVG